MGKHLSVWVYGATRILKLETIVMSYLFLSPFLVLTNLHWQNAIKEIIGKGLGAIIVISFVAKKLMAFDFSLKLNAHLLIFGALLLLLVLSSLSARPFAGLGDLFFENPSLQSAKIVVIIAVTMLCCYQLLDYQGYLNLVRLFYYSFLFSLLAIPLGMVYDLTPHFGSKVMRFVSFLHDPNIYGLYLSFIILLSYLFFLRAKIQKVGGGRKYAAIGLLAILALFFTFSRSGFVTLFLFSAILFAGIKFRLNRVMILFCCAFIFGIGGYQILRRMKTEVVAKSGLANFSDYIRVSTNMAAINIVREKFPWGVGYENAKNLLWKYQDRRFPIAADMFAVHNVFLILLAEVGLAGFLLFLIFKGLLLYESFKYFKGGIFPDNIMFIFSFCIVVAYLFHSLIYHYYFFNHMYYVLIIICLLTFKFNREIQAQFNQFVL